MKKEYEELIEPCKTLIKKGICLGCTALEDSLFKGNKECIYIKIIKKQKKNK